jgi:drug/metabolite transporter (DMT)-like permease
MKALLFTTFALIAFAGNSILCRMALGEGIIDAGSFTSLRLLSGIVTLLLIYKLTLKDINRSSNKSAANKSTSIENTSKENKLKEINSKGSWQAALMLFVYAIAFSYAYISLDTGTGALILFASVQITIIFISLLSGKKLYLIEWLGMITALAGFIYLVLPTVSTPSFSGFILMAIAGIAWGFYTLAGKGSTNPLADTTFNFFRTLPLAVLLTVFTLNNVTLTLEGVWLAILAGSITSGLGYTIWYIALGEISAIQAAVVQLLVPVIAAIGGVIFVNELFTIRLFIASLIILLGILTMIVGKQYSLKNI